MKDDLIRTLSKYYPPRSEEDFSLLESVKVLYLLGNQSYAPKELHLMLTGSKKNLLKALRSLKLEGKKYEMRGAIYFKKAFEGFRLPKGVKMEMISLQLRPEEALNAYLLYEAKRLYREIRFLARKAGYAEMLPPKNKDLFLNEYVQAKIHEGKELLTFASVKEIAVIEENLLGYFSKLRG